MDLEEGLSIDDIVRRSETFLNEKLKADLRNLLEARSVVISEIAEYEQVLEGIKSLQRLKPGQIAKTKVDIGCHVFAKAAVPEPQKIFVKVGFGFFVEFSHAEAQEFIAQKLDQLNEKTDSLTSEVARLQSIVESVTEKMDQIISLRKVADDGNHFSAE